MDVRYTKITEFFVPGAGFRSDKYQVYESLSTGRIWWQQTDLPALYTNSSCRPDFPHGKFWLYSFRFGETCDPIIRANLVP